MMRTRLLPLLVAALPVALFAQGDERDDPSTSPTYRASRVAVGVYGVNARPQGDFAAATNDFWGGGGQLRIALDRAGFIALRGDASFMRHGRRSQDIGLVPGAGNLIDGRVVTSNNVQTFMGGIELAQPTGPVRPYVNAMAGASYFFTRSELRGRGRDDDDGIGTTNVRDWVRSTALGGGVRLPIARSRRGTTVRPSPHDRGAPTSGATRWGSPSCGDGTRAWRLPVAPVGVAGCEMQVAGTGPTVHASSGPSAMVVLRDACA
ncbi:MAG: hypothetical protein MUF21_14310 [Gemmatimonadaceae bacterium]|nr:hypothetical protein [Gemmatimonadaceae bacterium]